MKIPIFEDCFSCANEDNFKVYEKNSVVKFPSSYKKLLGLCDGGFFEDINFLYNSRFLQQFIIGCVGMFHVISNDYPSEGSKFKTYYNNPPEFFPEGIISFASVGNGDLICFDYRADPQTDNPPIVMWEHEAAGSEEAVSFIAPDFEAFMNMLMSDEEAEKEYERLTVGK